jgi:hypothetical protein
MNRKLNLEINRIKKTMMAIIEKIIKILKDMIEIKNFKNKNKTNKMKKKNIINIEIEEIIINLMIMKNKLQIDFNKEKIIKIIKKEMICNKRIKVQMVIQEEILIEIINKEMKFNQKEKIHLNNQITIKIILKIK